MFLEELTGKEQENYLFTCILSRLFSDLVLQHSFDNVVVSIYLCIDISRG